MDIFAQLQYFMIDQGMRLIYWLITKKMFKSESFIHDCSVGRKFCGKLFFLLFDLLFAIGIPLLSPTRIPSLRPFECPAMLEFTTRYTEIFGSQRLTLARAAPRIANETDLQINKKLFFMIHNVCLLTFRMSTN